MSTHPLSELKQLLRDAIAGSDFDFVFEHLITRLPEGLPKSLQVREWQRQFNHSWKTYNNGSISLDERNRDINRISTGLLVFIGELAEADFQISAKSAAKSNKNGSILYQIPHQMQVGVEKRCTVRLAFDEAVLLENIALTDDTTIQSIRVADEMEVYLLDAEGGDAFLIKALHSTRQFLEADDFTEWVFKVKALREGAHSLILKVAVLEFTEGRERRKEIVLEETVQVQASEPEPAEAGGAGFRSAGYSFAFQSSMPVGVSYEIPQPVPTPNPSKGLPGGLRAMAFFLIFLMVGSTATYAITPKADRDYFFVRIQDKPEGYDNYIKKYGNDPNNKHVETAYYRKADKTKQPRDYRDYLEHQKTGEYKIEVTERLATLEIEAVKSIEQTPELAKIEKFVSDFGISQRLPEVVAIVEKQPTLAAQALPILEKAAIAEVKRQPTQAQLAQFVKVFPKSEAVEELRVVVEKHEATPQTTSDSGTEKTNPAVNQQPNEPVSTEKIDKISNISTKTAPSETPTKSEPVVSTPVETNTTNNNTTKTKPDETPKAPAAILKTIADGMVRVEGGSFDMGCKEGRDKDCYDSEKPLRENLPVKTFYLSKYEVTQAQWQAVMGDNLSDHKGCAQCPVENVSWNDVQDFIKKLNAATGQNYRLPTEAEWEYAARGGNSSKNYQYAGSNDLSKVGWYDDNSKSNTHEVGGLKANELGLFDMSGNVYEWCQDIYHNDYSSAPNSSEAWLGAGGGRVYRGGSYFSFAQNCRAADRYYYSPSFRRSDLGFRLARQ